MNKRAKIFVVMYFGLLIAGMAFLIISLSEGELKKGISTRQPFVQRAK